MSQHASVNYTGALAYEYADDLDDFVIPEDIQGPGKALHDHDHTDTKGLPSGRIRFDVAANRGVAADGKIFVATDTGVLSVAVGVTWHEFLAVDIVEAISAIWKFDGGMDWKQIASPAAPNAGYTRVYAKSDGRLYTKLPAGTESLIGALPTGVAAPYFGTVLPTNALWCDGHSDVVATYQALSDIIRPTTGGVDGTHFYLPDVRSRVVAGADNFGTGAASRTTIAAGVASGEDTHVLTTSELASHSHAVSETPHVHAESITNSDVGGIRLPAAANNQGSYSQGGANADTAATSTGITVGSSGSGTAHNIRQLTIGAPWIIGI